MATKGPPAASQWEKMKAATHERAKRAQKRLSKVQSSPGVTVAPDRDAPAKPTPARLSIPQRTKPRTPAPTEQMAQQRRWPAGEQRTAQEKDVSAVPTAPRALEELRAKTATGGDRRIVQESPTRKNAPKVTGQLPARSELKGRAATRMRRKIRRAEKSARGRHLTTAKRYGKARKTEEKERKATADRKAAEAGETRAGQYEKPVYKGPEDHDRALGQANSILATLQPGMRSRWVSYLAEQLKKDGYDVDIEKGPPQGAGFPRPGQTVVKPKPQHVGRGRFTAAEKYKKPKIVEVSKQGGDLPKKQTPTAADVAAGLVSSAAKTVARKVRRAHHRVIPATNPLEGSVKKEYKYAKRTAARTLQHAKQRAGVYGLALFGGEPIVRQGKIPKKKKAEKKKPGGSKESYGAPPPRAKPSQKEDEGGFKRTEMAPAPRLNPIVEQRKPKQRKRRRRGVNPADEFTGRRTRKGMHLSVLDALIKAQYTLFGEETMRKLTREPTKKTKARRKPKQQELFRAPDKPAAGGPQVIAVGPQGGRITGYHGGDLKKPIYLDEKKDKPKKKAKKKKPERSHEDRVSAAAALGAKATQQVRITPLHENIPPALEAIIKEASADLPRNAPHRVVWESVKPLLAAYNAAIPKEEGAGVEKLREKTKAPKVSEMRALKDHLAAMDPISRILRRQFVRNMLDHHEGDKLRKVLKLREKTEEPAAPRSHADTFDSLSSGQIIEADLGFVMGGSKAGKFKVGRRSKSKKYGSESITLIPIGEDGKPQKRGGGSQYRIHKRKGRDGKPRVSVSVGDMAGQIKSLSGGEPVAEKKSKRGSDVSHAHAYIADQLSEQARDPEGFGLSGEEHADLKTLLDHHEGDKLRNPKTAPDARRLSNLLSGHSDSERQTSTASARGLDKLSAQLDRHARKLDRAAEPAELRALSAKDRKEYDLLSGHLSEQIRKQSAGDRNQLDLMAKWADDPTTLPARQLIGKQAQAALRREVLKLRETAGVNEKISAHTAARDSHGKAGGNPVSNEHVQAHKDAKKAHAKAAGAWTGHAIGETDKSAAEAATTAAEAASKKAHAATASAGYSQHDTTNIDKLGLRVHASDVPTTLATTAHSGTSHTPERRAQQEQADYMAHMESVATRFNKLAEKHPDHAADIKQALTKYAGDYQRRNNDRLSKRGRMMSTMVTGGSGFKTRQNQKAGDSYDKSNNELLDWSKKTLKRLANSVNPRVISSDRSDAAQLLQAKIDNAEKLQQHMKAVNRIVKKKGLSDADKTAKLAEMGVSAKVATSLLAGDFAGRKGYAPYQLTNNNANIKRMKSRVAHIEKEGGRPTTEHAFSGGTVVDNAENNRVQIVFDGKPDVEMRTKLKRNGFNWSPSEGAWQRKRSDPARRVVREVLGTNPWESGE